VLILEDTRIKSMASTCKQAGRLPDDLREFVEDSQSKGWLISL
jgi:hypothetical protein